MARRLIRPSSALPAPASQRSGRKTTLHLQPFAEDAAPAKPRRRTTQHLTALPEIDHGAGKAPRQAVDPRTSRQIKARTIQLDALPEAAPRRRRATTLHLEPLPPPTVADQQAITVDSEQHWQAPPPSRRNRRFQSHQNLQDGDKRALPDVL